MNKTTIWRCGAALALVATQLSAAWATEPVDPRLDPQLPPAMRAQLVQRMGHLPLRQAPRQAQEGYIKLDVDPPVLTGLKLYPVDLGLAHPQLQADYVATDDLSGVRHLSFQVSGPQGQYIFVNDLDLGYPSKSASGSVGIDFKDLTGGVGTWTVTSLHISDNSGNARILNQYDLQALGLPSQFEATNPSGDTLAPTLVGGKVITPRVSLSRPAKGSQYGNPLAGLMVQAVDQGSPSPSGTKTMLASFCLASGFDCFTAAGSATLRGQAAMSLNLIGDVGPWLRVGKYALNSLSFTDFDGNTVLLVSNMAGGDTDFSQYFPLTVITLAR